MQLHHNHIKRRWYYLKNVRTGSWDLSDTDHLHPEQWCHPLWELWQHVLVSPADTHYKESLSVRTDPKSPFESNHTRAETSSKLYIDKQTVLKLGREWKTRWESTKKRVDGRWFLRPSAGLHRMVRMMKNFAASLPSDSWLHASLKA